MNDLKDQPLCESQFQVEFQKTCSLIDEFWENVKIENDLKTKTDSKCQEFQKEVWKIKNEIQSFRSYIQNVPLIVAFKYWLTGIKTYDYPRAEKIINHAEVFLKCKILPIKRSKEKLITIGDLAGMDHRHFIENIRCLKDFTFNEKEDLVWSYISFTCSLSNSTLNYIYPACDPDRQRVANRTVKYEWFVEFVQHLPERDSLIAKLIYFGAPSIEEVLNLKKSRVRVDARRINFSNLSAGFPKHIFADLQLYMNSHPGDLVFANLRGKPVERAHLNQAFSRASVKSKRKITPGDLLKAKLIKETC